MPPRWGFFIFCARYYKPAAPNGAGAAAVQEPSPNPLIGLRCCLNKLCRGLGLTGIAVTLEPSAEAVTVILDGTS